MNKINNKYKADYIFDGYELHTDAVLIIDENGGVRDLIKNVASDHYPEAQFFRGILAPGFINAHCHLELSHLKGIIEQGTGLPGFAGKVMGLRRFPMEQIEAGIRQADRQMWTAGIQAVGDICNTTDTLSQKKDSSIIYRNFIECLGFLPQQAAARFKYAYQVWQQFYQVNAASSLVPHAPYSVSPALFEKINQALLSLPDGEMGIISMHNQESLAENLFFETKTGAFVEFYKKLGSDLSFYQPSGKTSLQTVLPYLTTADILLLVHNTFSSNADLDFAQAQAERLQQAFYYVLCPGANLYIENRLPDINLLMDAGVSIALGTDSLASNDQLSIAAEMQHILRAYPDLAKDRLLGWATINGAQSLGLDKFLGSFEKGKTPGVILLSEKLEVIRRIH